MSEQRITLTPTQLALLEKYNAMLVKAQNEYALVMAGILAAAGIGHATLKGLDGTVLVVDDGVSEPNGT